MQTRLDASSNKTVKSSSLFPSFNPSLIFILLRALISDSLGKLNDVNMLSTPYKIKAPARARALFVIFYYLEALAALAANDGTHLTTASGLNILVPATANPLTPSAKEVSSLNASTLSNCFPNPIADL